MSHSGWKRTILAGKVLSGAVKMLHTTLVKVQSKTRTVDLDTGIPSIATRELVSAAMAQILRVRAARGADKRT